MGQVWYYARGGQQGGPVEWSQLQQLAATGQIGPADLVWSDGMVEWVAASTLPGLTPAPGYGGDPSQYGGAPSQYGAMQGQYGAGQGAGYGAPASGYQGQGLNYYGGQQGSGYAPVEYAGFWLRFVAALLDGLICCVIVIPITVGIAFLVGIYDFQHNPAIRLMTELISFVAVWPYFALQECSAAQATLGKRALGLIVTDMSGQRISFGKASGRYFGKLLAQCMCYIGYMMAGWTQQKQALHDMMAGCLVVRKH